MNNQALQYYMHDGSSAFRFELAGDLTGEGVRRLERDWYTASSVIGRRTLIVDMTFVTSAGEEGRALLARWHAGGARLIANSRGARELAEAIVGEPLQEFASVDMSGSLETWLPFRSSLAASLAHVTILLVALLFPVRVRAAKLRAEIENANTPAHAGHLGIAPAALANRTSAGAPV
jgi:hypothetical protein